MRVHHMKKKMIIEIRLLDSHPIHKKIRNSADFGFDCKWLKVLFCTVLKILRREKIPHKNPQWKIKCGKISLKEM